MPVSDPVRHAARDVADIAEGDLVEAAIALLPRAWAGEDVRSDLDALQRQVESVEDPEPACALWFARAAEAVYRGDTESSRVAATELAERAARAGLALWESRGRLFRAKLLFADWEETQGIDELAAAEALTDGHTEPSPLLCRTLLMVAGTHQQLGLFEESERVSSRACALLEQIDDDWSLQGVIYNRYMNHAAWAMELMRFGQDDEARERLRVALEEAQAYDLLSGMMVAEDLQVFVLLTELVSGEVSTDDAERRLADLEGRRNRGYASFGLAAQMVDERRYDDARRVIREGLEQLHPIEHEHLDAALRWLSASIEVLLAPDDPGRQRIWDYANYLSRKVGELRVRRRAGLQDRLHIHRMQREHEQVQRASLEDALTGVANRRCLDLERRRMETTPEQAPLAVFCLDLDGFKQVNDDLGHAVGDDVLRQLAMVLRGAVRQRDLVARYGGDEFVVLAHDCRADEATELAERIVERVRAHPWSQVHPSLAMTVSVGAAVGEGAYDLLFDEADRALYQAKAAGRDRASIRLVGGDLAPASLAPPDGQPAEPT